MLSCILYTLSNRDKGSCLAGNILASLNGLSHNLLFPNIFRRHFPKLLIRGISGIAGIIGCACGMTVCAISRR